MLLLFGMIVKVLCISKLKILYTFLQLLFTPVLNFLSGFMGPLGSWEGGSKGTTNWLVSAELPMHARAKMQVFWGT